MTEQKMHLLKKHIKPKLEAALSEFVNVLQDYGIPAEAVKIEFTLDANKLQLENKQFALLIDGEEVSLSTESQQFLLASCVCIKPCPDRPDPFNLGCYKCT